MKETTVKNIVDAAGGYGYFFEKHGLTNFAVRAWMTRGIPRRYWKFITKLTDFTSEDIETANRRAVQATANARRAK